MSRRLSWWTLGHGWKAKEVVGTTAWSCRQTSSFIWKSGWFESDFSFLGWKLDWFVGRLEGWSRTSTPSPGTLEGWSRTSTPLSGTLEGSSRTSRRSSGTLEGKTGIRPLRPGRRHLEVGTSRPTSRRVEVSSGTSSLPAGTSSLPSGRASIPSAGVNFPDEPSRFSEIFVDGSPGTVARPGEGVDVPGETVDGIDDGATILDETSRVGADEDGFQETQRVDRILEAKFSMEVVVDPKRASMVRTRRSMWPSPEEKRGM
jgi:hypothetical protein